MDYLKNILKHQSKIAELQYRFDMLCEDGHEITFDMIMENACWVIDCFEEDGHPLSDGRLGYHTYLHSYQPDKDLIKQYNQIKYFIKKWEK